MAPRADVRGRLLPACGHARRDASCASAAATARCGTTRASRDTETSVFGECGQFEERARWAHTICTLARAEGKRMMYGILPSAVADFPDVRHANVGVDEQ